ncbi:ATP-binding cassette domain-containing protein [Streptomyces inhibens]|uniref:ATP-binding cassette domain-containing protein n=1 Tax=Streptomyces inhibens TaxID=2293571 RepID=A0A371QAP0_STRIH|nr:ATP-binding cassette domain-containing protein [Streptomyces inhibens]REK91766.1 ATP-binding cassette domain-containing protein [Streptomyces inhibens]
MYHLTGVTKCYRSGRQEEDVVRALDGVGLYVEDGGGLAVQGPAGAGKSTLLRILGGLERPTRGSVELDGTDLATVTECRLARIRAESIGTVLGEDELAPGLTARQNVAGALVPLRLRPADCWELAGEALAEVGLSDQQGLFPRELDEGARRRVALARALVKRPTVLLADQPTAGLDADAREGVADLFARLWSERRLSCIVATEDEALARRAPRRATLSAGRVTAITRCAGRDAGGHH